jgi:hypothetical protein
VGEISALEGNPRQRLAQSLIDLARSYGVRVEVTSVRRSWAQQRRLYDRYKKGLSRFPAAPPGTSTHEKGLAFDLYVEPREALDWMGSLWERVGLTWGGRFHDPIHFDFRQRPGAPKRKRK